MLAVNRRRQLGRQFAVCETARQCVTSGILKDIALGGRSMDLLDKQTGLGDHLRDEYSPQCLDELRNIQKAISEQHTGRLEIFDPGLNIALGSERTVAHVVHGTVIFNSELEIAAQQY